MDISRYRDKAYLVTYELTTDIFDTFNVKVDEIIPVRSVYILCTDQGTKILKKFSYSLDELRFINSAVDYIRGNGYEYVVPFMKTADGGYYIERYDGIYVMLDLIEGREADFENPLDISQVSKSLCGLHNAAAGLDFEIEKRNNLFLWIPTFMKRAEELQKFREIAEFHEIKTDFDELFLKSFDDHYDQALKSIELLKKSPYLDLCSRALNYKSLCHHDLAYHNMIIDNSNHVYFVDFDFCIVDLRAHDIANLIIKTIKHYSWDIERAQNVIDSYSSMSSIGKDEIEVIHGFLTFPQDFYEVGRQYYMKTKRWDDEEFYLRLQRKVGYYNERNEFLKKYKELYTGA